MLHFPSLVESDALLKDSSERTLAFFMAYYISQFGQKNISVDSCSHLPTLMEDKNKIKKKLVKFFTLFLGVFSKHRPNKMLTRQ